MRTPKSPEPSTLRQAEPEIQRGELDTRVREGAFGGISPQNIEREGETASLGMKVQEQADNYLVNKGMALWSDKVSDVRANMTNAKGENAQQFTPDIEDGAYQKTINPIKQQVMDVAKDNPRASALLSTKLEKSEAALKSDVNTNVVRQTYLANVAKYDGRIDDIQKNIPTYLSPGSIAEHRGQLEDLVRQRLQTVGKQATADDQVDKFLQTYDSQVVTNYLANGDVPNARAYAQKIKDDGGVIPDSVQKKIFETGTRQDAESWYSVASKRFRSVDGQPDQGALERAIDSNKNLNLDQKDIYYGVVKAKAGMDIKADIQAHKNSWKTFQDWITNQSGNFTKPLSTTEIFNNATKWGFDQTDAHNLAKWAASQYASDKGLTLNFGSPVLQTKHFTDIREQIAMGNIGSLKALESIQGSVTAKQFGQLKNEWFKTMEGGQDTQKETVLRRVRAMGTDVFGTDQSAMNNYMNTMMDKYHGLGANGDANTVLDAAKEYLKGDAPKASNIWKMQYADRGDTLKTDTLRTFYTDYGKEVTDGIGETLRKQLGRTPTADDFGTFINSIGGDDAVKRFTPTNNAMLSIIRWNEQHPQFQPIPLDAKSIDKAVETYQQSAGVF